MPAKKGQKAAMGLQTRYPSDRCKWRITALIGLPIRASVGGFFDSLGYANSVNPTSIFAAIKNGLAAGASSIGLDVGTSLLKNITGTSLLSTIGTSITSGDIFGQFFGLAKNLILSPFKVLGDIGSGLQSLGSVIQEKGLGGALESFATSIFGRKTVETIFNAGGIGGFLDGVQVDTLLPTGVQAKKLSIGGVADLFFDLAGNVIGVLENGVYRIGEFVVDALGQVKQLSGKLIATLLGHDIEADVINGALKGFKANIDGVEIEGQTDDGVFIPGPEHESGFGSLLGDLFSGVIKIAGGALAFAFESGLLTDIISIPEAEASISLPLPNPIINIGDTLLKALQTVGALSTEDTKTLKDKFGWLVHYTDFAGINGILGSNTISTNSEGEAFLSKETPTAINQEDAWKEIAMNLQLSYRDSEMKINKEKAEYFIVIDAEDIMNEAEVRPVQRDLTLSDPDGNAQPASPTTGALEYVFDRVLPIAGKIIWPPVGSPALLFGHNSVANWVLAQAAILKYYLDKAQS